MYSRYLNKLLVVLIVSGFLVLGIQTQSTAQQAAPANNAGQQPPNAAAGKEKPKFAPERFIIKFKSGGPQAVNEDVQYLLESNRRFQNAVSDRSNSLDRLRVKHKIKKAKSVFIERYGLSTAEAKRKLTNRQRQSGKRFPHRIERMPKDAEIPDLSNVYVMEVPEGSDMEKIINDYKTDPHVEYAEPDYIMEANMVPNDPYYSFYGSWGQNYDDLWGLKKIQTEQAWDTTQGEGVVVAVVDTGLDYNHPDIAGNVWVNPCEDINHNGLVDSSDFNGTDDPCPGEDPNRLVDDVRGWDFTGATIDLPAEDNDPIDGNGHGTHVAGTIAAAGNNGIGIIGVAPQSKVMALKGLSDSGQGYSSLLANALRYAADNGADVINNSWGGAGYSQTIKDAVDYAHATGCVVIVAAGNETSPAEYQYPANLSKVITVAASDQDDLKTYFSNYGAKIDVTAPGGLSNILSLLAYNSLFSTSPGYTSLIVGNKYIRLQGTSMAAPHVAGVAALILSRNPTFTPEQVRYILRRSADDIEQAGFDEFSGYGRINAFKAVSSAYIPPNLFAEITSPSVRLGGSDNIYNNGSVTLRGSALGDNFSHYQVSYAPYLPSASTFPNVSRAGVFTTVISNTTPVVNNILGEFDTTVLASGRYFVRLAVFDFAGNSTESTVTIYIDHALKAGWPRIVSSWKSWPPNMRPRLLEYSPTFADLDNDGSKEVIVVEDNKLFVWRHDGSPFHPDFPVTISGLSAAEGIGAVPAIGDLDEDGLAEIILMTFVPGGSNPIYAFHSDGTSVSGFPSGNPDTVIPSYVTDVGSLRPPVITDLEGDGQNDIVALISTGNKNYPRIYLVALDKNGNMKQGWPIVLSDVWEYSGYFSPPSVADLDGDGRQEIIVGTTTANIDARLEIYKYNGLLQSATILRSGKIAGDPILVADTDRDGDLEMLVSVWDQGYLLDHRGIVLPGWPKTLRYPYRFVDLDGNNNLEIIGSGTFSYNIIAYYSNGSSVPGFFLFVWDPHRQILPGKLNDIVMAPMAQSSQIAFIFNGPRVSYGMDNNGSALDNWPKFIPPSDGSFSIGDLDNDGVPEVGVHSLDGMVYIWEEPSLQANPLENSWPTLYGNNQRTNLYNVNQPPVLAAIGNKIVNEGANLTFTVSATDPDGDTLTYRASGLPSGATFSGQTFSWTPAFTQAGIYNVTFTVSDGSLTDTETITVTVVNVLADLVTSALSTATTAVAPGKAVSISVAVKNQGGAPAGSFTVAFSLSKDQSYGGSDDIALAGGSVSGLASGSTVSRTISPTVPSTTPLGNYYICAVVDKGNTVTEEDETNNSRCTSTPIQVVFPDLVVTQISGPTTAATGTVITISSTVKNQSATPAGSFYAGLYLSTDTVITTADIGIARRSLGSLAGDAANSANTGVTLPTNLAPGTYYIGAIADYANTVTESSETNNALTGQPITITAGPDLVITAVSGPASAWRGMSVSISNTIKNQGVGKATNSSSVGLYLSKDSVITTADTLIGTRTISGLAAGKTNTANSTVIIPSALTVGSYYIGAIGDYTNTVKENNETNNARAGNTIVVR